MAVDNERTLVEPARSPFIRRSLPAIPVLLVTLLMALLAWRVSADENILLGTEADTIYIADGFYAPEKSAEHGPYRWTEPLAQLRLPNWGPGRIHIIVEGIAGAEGRIALKLGPATLAETHVTQGRPWQLQGWGDTTDRTPPVSLEAPPFNPPGEARALGVLVKRLEIYAPSARLRAWLNIALLGLAGLLLYAFLLIRTDRTFFSTLAGASIPALYAPLAAYRDPWMDTVAWAAPIALSIALLAARLRDQGSGTRDQKLEPRNPVSHITTNPHSAIRIPHSAIALTAALLLLYLGYMNAFDSDRMYQVAAGIAEYGRPTRYPSLDTWTKYGFGQPLIAVPFYLLGKLFSLPGGDPEAITRLTVSFTNLVVTALTLLLLYKAARRFADVNISLAVAATYLLATPALNYGRTFFSEPAGALLLLAAILLTLPHRQPTTDNRQLTTSPQRTLLAGLCLGAMLLFKPAFAVYWLPIGLAVLWLSARLLKYKSSPTTHRPSPPTTGNRQLATDNWRPSFAPLAAFA
ncbi:MAG: glycosyltransferase family 39 protein, partial [Chloroflexia bacterium]